MVQKKGLIKTYDYDPLDRLTGVHAGQKNHEQFFYDCERLITEKEGAVSRSLMHVQNQLLAQAYVDDQSRKTTLLSTNRQCSVLHSISRSNIITQAFTPFGHHHIQEGLTGLPGFNGERPDPLTGHYHLGKGHRAYNPHLMRFNSPDQLSPFGAGGLNTYAYCAGDPVNRSDPSGRVSVDDILIAGMGVIGVLGGGIGLYSALRAASKLKAAKVSTDLAVKIAGSTLNIAGGLIGVTRLTMGAAGDETGKSGMIAAQLILTLPGLVFSGFGTGLGVMNARRQKKLGQFKADSISNISASSSGPTTVGTSLSASSSSSGLGAGSTNHMTAPPNTQKHGVQNKEIIVTTLPTTNNRQSSNSIFIRRHSF